MNAGQTISLSLIFSIVSMVGVIVNIFGTYKRDSDVEKKKEIDIEKNFARISVKLDEFGRQISEVVKRSEKSGDKIEEISREITKQNERITTLFHYKDDHEKRLSELEEKIK